MYRITTLLKADNKLFHTRDLALLFGIKNTNTLYTLIKRYVQKNILYPIHKGYYATVPIHMTDPVLLGIGCLHQYAYVSGEYILACHEILFQHSPYITLISSASKKFSIGDSQYLVRKMTDTMLYNPIGLTEKNGYFIADVERAAADLLYYNPNQHFDNRSGINWTKVKNIQKEVRYL